MNGSTWLEKFNEFIESDQCPNFVLADIERAKKHIPPTCLPNQDSDDEDAEPVEQPAWCELIQPTEVYDDYVV